MTAVRVVLHGCDDTTYIDMDVTEAEMEFLDRLASLSKEASDYGCQPTMSRTEPGDGLD